MEKRQKATAGPSTSLRSAQDDSIFAELTKTRSRVVPRNTITLIPAVYP
jgi:hypothetical protein